MLNLGHTFAHALEAAAGYEGVTPRPRGRARPARRAAPLRPGHRPVVEEMLRPQPVRVDRERAWEAHAARQEGASAASSVLVLLGDDGPRRDVAVPAERRAPRTR